MPTHPNVRFLTYKFRINSLLPLAGMSKCHNAENVTLTQGLSENMRNEVAVLTAAAVIIILIISSCPRCNYDPLSNAATPSPPGGEGLRLLAPHLHRLETFCLPFSFLKWRWPTSYGVGEEGTPILRQDKPAGRSMGEMVESSWHPQPFVLPAGARGC